MQRVSHAAGIRQPIRCIRGDTRADRQSRKGAALRLLRGKSAVSVGHVKVNVIVKPKEAVLDPQGNAVRDAMRHLGMPEVRSVRIGKYMEINVDGEDVDLEKRLHGLCRDLLSNPVIEDYELQKTEVRDQKSEMKTEKPKTRKWK
jgi:phosphoribosylformylglycinamidine synthase